MLKLSLLSRKAALQVKQMLNYAPIESNLKKIADKAGGILMLTVLFCTQIFHF